MSDLKNIKMEGSDVPAEQIKNPELLEAIEVMQADGSPENINKMISKVVNAKFILPAMLKHVPQAKTQNGKTVMSNATQVQFRLLENNKKERFFGAFTDTDEMFKWNGNEKSAKIVTDFDSLAAMVMDPHANVLGFVINPFGKSVTFPKNMVMSIKQQRDYMRMEGNKINSGSNVKVGEPKEYPIDLMAALINHFSTEPNVNAAYLRLIEQDGQMSYFVVVDFYGDMEETFKGISDIAKPYLDEEFQLSMMPYSMEFAKNAVKGIEPFYKKAEE